MKKKKKAPEATAVNGSLIRRPIQRCFPIFVLPTFICFTIGFLWPFVQGIFLSFCEFITPSDIKEFVGFENYIDAVTDNTFMHAFWYTSLFTIVYVPHPKVLSPSPV